MDLRWTERSCRSAVSRTRIPGSDYCANPYVGCGHRCAYCYAPIVARRRGMAPPASVEAKIDVASVARAQLGRLRPGRVVLSSQTDPYQPLEERLELSRALLGELLRAGFAASVLTKSDLVVRDADLLTRFPRGRATVGLSVSTTDEDLREAIEPGAPSLERRLEALRELRRRGVRTWAFLAPVLPGTTTAEVRELVAALEGLVDSLLVDRLNYPRVTFPRIAAAVAARGRAWAARPDRGPGEHLLELSAALREAGRRHGVPVSICHAPPPRPPASVVTTRG